jgi:hypothetical protein
LGPGFWIADLPTRWPDPPREISFSTLSLIEACPRQWALRQARYPSIWDQEGYPPRINLAALSGKIVHDVVEKIIHALIGAGCGSVRDPGSFPVLKNLGGLSALVENSINHNFRRFSANPRCDGVRDSLKRDLQSRTSEMRTNIQKVLSLTEFSGRASAPERKSKSTKGRLPLSEGTYTEIDLRAPNIGWRGRVDLLKVLSSACDITDFKTGAPKPADQFQVLIYAFLWLNDQERNASGKGVGSLTLSYPSGLVRVPTPSMTGMDELGQDLKERGELARSAVSASPPPAKMSAENCTFCEVRHLCPEYWSQKGIETLASSQGGSTDRCDLEIAVTGRHGPKSWDGRISIGNKFQAGRQIILRTQGTESVFSKADRIRVLDGFAQSPEDVEEESSAVVATSKFTEIYVVPE